MDAADFGEILKYWLFLFAAIISEVTATSSLKASDGFIKLLPSIIVVVGYALSFYFLSLVLKVIPIGIVRCLGRVGDCLAGVGGLAGI